MNFGLSGVYNMKSAFKMKLLKILVLVLSISVLLCCLTACNQPQSESNVIVTISKKDVTLDLFEGTVLTATVKNSDKNVVWSSSDESVVTINDGHLFALKEGTVIITATVEDKSAECEVTVWSSGATPLLVVENQNVVIDNGADLPIDCFVKYKNAKVSATITFTSSNASVVSVSANGVIKGESTGTATVTVTARYYTFETAKIINITII